MKKTRNYGLYICCLLLSAVSAHAQTINTFTVQQAVDYANKNSVQVKNALLDILIQKQVNRDVTSIALPQINGTVGVTRNLDIAVQSIPNFIAPATYQVLIDEGVKNGNGQPVTFPAGGFGNLLFPFGNPWNANAGITLSQLIFDGQVFIALKARNGTISLQEKIAALTQENIKANVYKIYYQLVAGKTQIELLDANIKRLEKLKHDVQVMYDNGFTEKVDIDKLSVQVANLQTEKLKAENMITNGYAGLKLLMGMPVKDSLVLTDTLSDEKIKEGILEATQFKYSDRKDFQISELTNTLNGLNVRRYKLSQIPTFALVGGYSKQAQRNKFDFFEKGDWFTSSYIGIQMKLPIFNGFSLNSKIKKAQLELQKSRNQTEALKINIDGEVNNAKNNFIAAIATMDFQKKNMELAEKVYEQTKKKYEIGTGSASEINAAQVDLKTAQTNYLSALYDAIIARVDFLKATGKL
ncbi:MAG: TolC family protein [Ferruginibacter sp.]|nr:TolC family protein [Bacteroidota bacterium]MBX2917607.1 TolC family protein [Ferruginibacter sp.]